MVANLIKWTAAMKRRISESVLGARTMTTGKHDIGVSKTKDFGIIQKFQLLNGRT